MMPAIGLHLHSDALLSPTFTFCWSMISGQPGLDPDVDILRDDHRGSSKNPVKRPALLEGCD
jgi:hypothetical protein